MILFLGLVFCFVELSRAATCGYGEFRKAVRDGYEYLYVGERLSFSHAGFYCENYLANEEVGFPFGDLVKPTTEELQFIRREVIPNASVEFTTGHYRHYVSNEQTPQSWGIYTGHGVDAENHWIETNLYRQTGVILSTNQVKFDQYAGELIPLYATESTSNLLSVCKRKVTDAFPANMGNLDGNYECNHITKKFLYFSKEYVAIREKMTFNEALHLCENLENEGFPNGRLGLLDTTRHNTLRYYFYNTREIMWTAAKYDESLQEYVDVHTGEPYDLYWNLNEPSTGDCVRGANSDHSSFVGPFETTDCEDKYHFVCERPIDTIDTVTTKVLDNKEYTITTRRANYTEAQLACKIQGATLMQSTTEELNLVRSELVPGRLEFWLGYSTTDTSQYTPASYGITEGKHGASMDHWAEDQPKYPGGIIVTKEFGYNDETGVIYPLLSQASFSEQHYYVCVRDLTIVRETDTEEVPETSNSQFNELQFAGATLIVVGLLLTSYVITKKVQKGREAQHQKPESGVKAPTV